MDQGQDLHFCVVSYIENYSVMRFLGVITVHVIYCSGFCSTDRFIKGMHIVIIRLWFIGPFLYMLLNEGPQVRIRLVAGIVALRHLGYFSLE